MKILQFDPSIKYDTYRYTTWIKLIGLTYNIRVNVLLIANDTLYTLDNKEVDFTTLLRSNIIIDKHFFK
jgi:hypothetical protein